MLRNRMQNDQGFTLIELLMAITVTGIIFAALTTGYVSALKGTKGAHERLTESHDAQLLAIHFPSDVQSADAELIALNPGTVTDSATSSGCGTGSVPPADSENKLRVQWTEVTAGSTLTAFSAAYRLEPVSATEAKLVRYYCSGSTPIPSGSSLNASNRNALLLLALAGAAATTDTVAHDLAISQDPPTIAGRIISWALKTSLKPADIADSQYAFDLQASMRKLEPTAASGASSLTFGVPAGIKAGTPFNVTVNLPGFTGTKTLTWSGPGSAPNATSGPIYPTSPVQFTNGVSDPVSITLVKAESSTLNVTDGTTTGQSSFTVNGGPATQLAFTNCSVNGGAPGTCTPNVAVEGNKNKYMNAFVSVIDTYGNTATVPTGTSWPATVTSDDQSNFEVSFSPPLMIVGPATESGTAFKVTHQSNADGPATITASTPSLAGASMTVSED